MWLRIQWCMRTVHTVVDGDCGHGGGDGAAERRDCAYPRAERQRSAWGGGEVDEIGAGEAVEGGEREKIRENSGQMGFFLPKDLPIQK